MTKTFVIAVREYLAAVKTKGFLVGLILMPLLMGGGVVMQSLTKNLEDPSPRTIAVLDQTPGESLLATLQAAAEAHDAKPAVNGPKVTYTIRRVPPDAGDADAALLSISDRLRRGELTAFVQIERDVLTPPSPATQSATAAAAGRRLFFTTNRLTLMDVREFVGLTLQPRVLAVTLGESPQTIERVVGSEGRVLQSRGLARRDESGRLVFEPKENEIAQAMLPVGMVIILFMVVLVGASPLTTNIIEEKQLRIAEVLLGSVSPFELMLGKLIGGVATSLTLGAIYVAGAAVVASKLGLLAILSPGLVAWFVVFTIVASLMYGALFVVAGAAATNVKEAQALMTPMMLVVVLPLFLVGPMMSEPHGRVGLAGTFFPLTAPMVAMMRLTTPPALPWWQPVAALVSSGLMTVALVWLAGRVFRAGFLLVGRPAKFRELLGWIVKG